MRETHRYEEEGPEGLKVRKKTYAPGVPGQGLIVPAIVVAGVAAFAWQALKNEGDGRRGADRQGTGTVAGERTPGGASHEYEATGEFQYIGSQAEIDSLVTDADRGEDGRVEVVIGLSYRGGNLDIRQRVQPRSIGSGREVISYSVPEIVVTPDGDSVAVPGNATVRIGRQAPRSLADAIAGDVDAEGAAEASASISGLDNAYGTGGIPTTAEAGSMVDLTMTFGNRGSITLEAQVVANDIATPGDAPFVVGYYIPREATINGETFTVNPEEVTVSIAGSTPTRATDESNFYRPLSQD